jgi:hypothetical protein
MLHMHVLGPTGRPTRSCVANIHVNTDLFPTGTAGPSRLHTTDGTLSLVLLGRRLLP